MSSSPSALDVLVLAAGKGTRMRSSLPKVLHRLCGRTLIERTIRAIEPLNPRRIVVMVGFGKDLVEQELARLREEGIAGSAELVAVHQKEQRGTGHAVQVALAEISDFSSRLLVLPGDVPLIRTETLSTLVSDESLSQEGIYFLSGIFDDPSGFGRVVRDAGRRVLSIVEDRDCSPEERELAEINSSMYLFPTAFLRSTINQLQSANAQGELYLTDVIQHGVRADLPVEAFPVANNLEIAGANNRAELVALEDIRREQINRAWMEAGVSM
ncbi:MAG: NTP transferase domain-containing protein, partial [Bdellovibrionales bacterium]|nr:NTP transferase domain-containing protein [Bdellovibrionales bacterium]